MLISQKESQKYDGWIKDLCNQIESKFQPILEKKFPCNFARKAFANKMVKFIPVEYDHEKESYNYEGLLVDLINYLESTKLWNGKFNTAYPLLVIFEPHKKIESLQYCEQVFIELIKYLLENDPAQWPKNTPQNPNNKFWSMCFNDIQIFINVSHPHHNFRNSRNLCDSLVLVINPRERFDKFAGSTEEGIMIRKTIRENINKYDEIPHSPLLGHYFLGELEWPQYMLPTTNDGCPISFPLEFME